LFGIEFNLVPDVGVVKLGPGDKGVAVSVGIGKEMVVARLSAIGLSR
jgi:hypothetical protein